MAEQSRDAGVIVNYRYPEDQHSRWKDSADHKGQSLKEWIRRALNRAADEQEAERERKRRR